MSNILSRILADLVLVCCVALVPWWVVTILALMVLVTMDTYEIVLLGVMMDALMGASVEGWFGIEWVHTLVFLAAVLLYAFIRPRLVSFRS